MSRKLRLHNRAQKIKNELKLNNVDLKEEFLKEKFKKMAVSPYTFYRGSNHLYWEDFYNDWRINFFGGSDSTMTWINGDAHIYNYGAYANHHGEAIFCMDDFDDAIIADYQFDLWRMAISILLDCRDHGVFSDLAQKKALNHFAEAYLREMSTHEVDDPSNEIHLNKSTAKGLLKKFLKKVEKKKNRLKMLNKWTVVQDGKRKFDLENPKLDPLNEKERAAVEKAYEQYKDTLEFTFENQAEHLAVKDIAKRVKAGTGSLGSARYYLLIEAESDGADDDVILDMKEQGRPPLYRHMNKAEKNEYDTIFPHEGERHAFAFKALAEHADRYLGWTSIGDTPFSIKERSPFKCDFDTEGLKKPKHLYLMSRVWGNLLAARHKRASYVLNEQAHEMPIAFSEKVLGNERDFKSLVSSVALRYAERVQEDYAIFSKMVAEQQ